MAKSIVSAGCLADHALSSLPKGHSGQEPFPYLAQCRPGQKMEHIRLCGKLFFSEEKNQKTFVFWAWSPAIEAMAGE
jgi:hypothetical protein